MTNTIKWDKPCYKCLSHLCDLSCKETSKTEEQDDEVLGFNGWGFPIEKPNKALIEKTADHDVDCLCIDCSMVDEQDDVPWTDKAFERLCENWNNMTSAEFAIVQRFLFGVYAHPPVPTAQPKEPEQEPVGEAYLCDLCHTPFDGAFQCPSCGHNEATKEPVYTTPPQRTWVGLTDEDLAVCGDEDDVMLARYWERVCKEKNNA